MNSTEIDLEEDDQALMERLSINDPKGRKLAAVGLLATIYFDEPCTREKREIVAMLAEEYIARFGSYLRFTKDRRDAKVYPLHLKKVPSPKDWLPDHPDGEGWYFGLSSANTAREAGEHTVYGYCGAAFKKGLGYFHFSVPLNSFADEEGGFRKYLLHACEQLKPISGYGGIGVIEPLNYLAGEACQPLIRQLGERFPGLEIEDRIGHTIHLKSGIKGVNWLTVLGDRWIQEMGGLDFLRLWVTEACTLYPYPGGVVIQAGSRPEIGDVQANRWPMHYVRLAKALKKIRVKDHYPFHFGGENRFDHEATMKWINRFDDH